MLSIFPLNEIRLEDLCRCYNNMNISIVERLAIYVTDVSKYRMYYRFMKVIKYFVRLYIFMYLCSSR